jgi:SAM-dependent methyltransferase
MAADFAKNTSGEKKEKERQETLQKLIRHNALWPGAKVLDIGAGPGSWALPLAETAGEVTALEPADGMVAILKSRIADTGTKNIIIDQNTWQSVAIEEKGWQNRFDLVFASMTPGIDGPSALRKMMTASRGSCYLSAFSGSGWRGQYSELWQTFFNEPMGEQPNDIIYPFNLVYAMGYRPHLEFSWWDRDYLEDRDKAIERFCLFFENYLELTNEVKAEITRYIDKHTVDGQFGDSRRTCRGMMVWDMTQNQTNTMKEACNAAAN